MRIIGLETLLVVDVPLAVGVVSLGSSNVRQMQAYLPEPAAIGHQSAWS